MFEGMKRYLYVKVGFVIEMSESVEYQQNGQTTDGARAECLYLERFLRDKVSKRAKHFSWCTPSLHIKT